MMVWAWFPRKLLAAVILVGQVKRDRTFERQSFEGISAEKMSDQNCMSADSIGW